MVLSELSYLTSILIESFKAFDPEGDGTFEFEWQKTTKNYWNSIDFKINVINLLPFGLLGEIPGFSWMRIFWMTKVYRIMYFLRIFEYRNYNRFLQSIFKLVRKEDNPNLWLEQPNNLRQEHDSMKQQTLIYFQYLFKLLGQMIQLGLFCWILGIIYYYSINILSVDSPQVSGECNDENFFDYSFKTEDPCIKNKSISNQVLIMFYYMITTMSTVGLGDYRPTNDLERAVIIPYLLFGYLFFGYIVGETQEVVEGLSNSMKDFHDVNNLFKFQDTLRRLFNGGIP